MTLGTLSAGALVAVIHGDYVHLLDEQEVVPEETASGEVFRVPDEEMRGGWLQRRWTQGEGVKTFAWNSLICPVRLTADRTLDPPSVERLRKLGVDM